jgi:hypothetical protein
MAYKYYKAKESYKALKEDESYLVFSRLKHKGLLDGEPVKLDPTPAGFNFSEHLTECNEDGSGIGSSSKSQKSKEPSNDWSKDELKEYMIDNSIAFNSGDTKSDLLDKIKNSNGGSQ